MSVHPFSGDRTARTADGSTYERTLTAATVYAFFDSSGEAIYVGVTTSPWQRIFSHGTKDWWTDVGSIAVEHFEHDGDARLYERRLIAELLPRENQAGVPAPVLAERARAAASAVAA